MNDDFNSPIVIANLFDGVRWINSVNDGKASLTKIDLEILRKLYNDFVFEILGLKSEETDGGNDELLNGVMDTILDLREEAKQNKDWGTADKIRDHLSKLNVIIKDTKEGASWEIDQ